MKKKNNAPHLPEEKINQLVKEMTNPHLSPLSIHNEEELLLLRILERKLKEGLIKAEMTKDGKLWLKTSKPTLGGTTQIKYQVPPFLKNLLELEKHE